MCGIAAAITSDQFNIEYALAEMAHRGRDSRGTFQQEVGGKTVYLGHNRLAIVDTSPKGVQPMIIGDTALIVNGEVWNYPSLRAEYESRGYTFQSNSDSEIIIYLHREGELHRLDGMYSFILYSAGRLIISRDWHGKMPLYIINKDGDYFFSSELKGLKEMVGDISTARFVPKNSLVSIDVAAGELDITYDYYYRVGDEITVTGTDAEVARRTYELLDIAVKKRLLADVPVCSLLSGGIDSSIIVHLLDKYIDVTAYTVRFDEAGRDLHFARMVADYLKIKLVEVDVPNDPELIKLRFLETIWAVEYPLAVQIEVGLLCSYMAEQIKKDGFKVVFSGEGSDESYGSYGFLRKFKDKPDWSDIRKAMFERQYYGNLLRSNTVFMYFGTAELRTPFFDRDFLDYTLNLPNRATWFSNQWKLPLANAFLDHLPKEVITQEKRAFQKGTNFKAYVEELVLTDPKVNFKNRAKTLHVVTDNFERLFGVSSRNLRKPL